MSDTKHCQFCGEDILAVAIKCKHCGSMLSSPGVEVASPSAVAVQTPSADYGTFLLAIPVVSIFLIIFWVGNMNLLQSPGNAMALIMIGTVVGTAILAAMEASKLGMVSDREEGTYSPTAWFFLICLLWIIGYPAYLLKRKKFGLKNRLVLGLLIALVFIVVFFSMDSSIESKRAEVQGNLEQLQKNLDNFGK